MLRSALKILVPAIALLVVGCRVAPIYEVPQSQLMTSRAVSLSDVERAIRTAGAGLGWQMAPRGPGNLEGVLILREHRAVVDVKFDTKSFSIKYKDSSNLGYNGSTIHPNYNGWVQNLERAIRAQVSTL
jgi:hypothetical protein